MNGISTLLHNINNESKSNITLGYDRTGWC